MNFWVRWSATGDYDPQLHPEPFSGAKDACAWAQEKFGVTRWNLTAFGTRAAFNSSYKVEVFFASNKVRPEPVTLEIDRLRKIALMYRLENNELALKSALETIGWEIMAAVDAGMEVTIC